VRIVTVAPKNAACLAVPREPARYAPTTVLPCPGDIACIPPSAKAINNPINITPGRQIRRRDQFREPVARSHDSLAVAQSQRLCARRRRPAVTDHSADAFVERRHQQVFG